jgi:hypothetical protein
MQKQKQMKKQLFCVGAVIVLSSVIGSAQLPIKIPKISMPKITTPKPETPQTAVPINSGQPRTSNSHRSVPTNLVGGGVSNRQLVMDDGFTFFRADPVKGRNPNNTGDIDVGWSLTPSLRLIGTFPDNSGFRVVVRKDGKEGGKFFCSSSVYRKDSDPYLINTKRSATHEDYMMTSKCAESSSPLKTLGWHDVEIYYVDGKTDAEKLIRKHKIDVHKAEQIKGFKGREYAGVADYYVQRFAEASAGILHAGGAFYMSGSAKDRPFTVGDKKELGVRSIDIFLPISPDKRTNYKAYLKCSVNGQKITLAKDGIESGRPSTAQFFYETALAQRNDPKFVERIEFTFLKAVLPLSIDVDGPQITNVSKNPGKWECKIMENGETYRIIRFEVGSDGQIVPHPEQQNGNVNLYPKTYLIDVEVPADSSIDARSMPMPDAGLFYGIPWTTAEGRAAARHVPKKGIPYLVIPK